jgi:hypothetical protein
VCLNDQKDTETEKPLIYDLYLYVTLIPAETKILKTTNQKQGKGTEAAELLTVVILLYVILRLIKITKY